ncbi:MAG: hypothetical protein VYE31_00915 [Pseudomonadota bacterium]|nr:hypothetical protein [Pseudomonadota bacterium]
MKLLELTDQEILKIADPLWDELIKASNNKDYGGFTKNFSKTMLMGTDEVTLGKQWAGSQLLESLSKEREFFGCLRRNEYITILYKQRSESVPGDFLGRLVLGIEDDKIKIFGATIF